MFWAVGGTAGLDTVGGSIERLRERSPSTLVAIWVLVTVKALGTCLGVAAFRFPRRPVRALAWLVAGVLTLYGGILTAVEALVVTGAVAAPSDVDRIALRGHVYLSDPWFLLWGPLLLGALVSGPGFRRRNHVI